MPSRDLATAETRAGGGCAKPLAKTPCCLATMHQVPACRWLAAACIKAPDQPGIVRRSWMPAGASQSVPRACPLRHAAFVRGLQGSNGTYLKVGATCKVKRLRGWWVSVIVGGPCDVWWTCHYCVQTLLMAARRLSCVCCAPAAATTPAAATPRARGTALFSTAHAAPLLNTLQHYVGNDLENWMGTTRYTIDVRPSARDLRDTWLVRSRHWTKFGCSDINRMVLRPAGIERCVHCCAAHTGWWLDGLAL